MSASARWLAASTPAVGSSSTSSSASEARARAISARRCWPPDSLSIDRLLEAGQPDGLDGRGDVRPVGASRSGCHGREAGQAAAGHHLRRPSSAGRWRWRGAGARSPPATARGAGRPAGRTAPPRRPGPGRGRASRARASTCPSRSGRAAPPPRPRSTSRSTPPHHGAAARSRSTRPARRTSGGPDMRIILIKSRMIVKLLSRPGSVWVRCRVKRCGAGASRATRTRRRCGACRRGGPGGGRRRPGRAG